MVKLRLKRFGKKFQPFYRIVAIKSRTKREGASLEDLGHYSPIKKELVLKKERIEYWMSVGAQPSDTVRSLLIKQNIIKKDKSEKKAEFKTKPGRKSQERSAAKAEKAENLRAEKEAAKEAAKQPKVEEKAEPEVAVEATTEAEVTE